MSPEGIREKAGIGMINSSGTADVWQKSGRSRIARTLPRLARNREMGNRPGSMPAEGKGEKDEEGSPDGSECVHAFSGRPRKTLGLCDLLDIPCRHVNRERCGASAEGSERWA